MIKSRRLRWAGHVARMEEGRIALKILTGKPTAKRPLLVGIFYIYYSDNLIFFIINTFYIGNIYLYLRIILAFLVKIPIFIVHL